MEDKLGELGLSRQQIAAAAGNIIARMAQPGSELGTHTGLKDTSAMGEDMDFDLDASGFVRRVQFFAGNASEPTILKGMLTGLGAAPGRSASYTIPLLA